MTKRLMTGALASALMLGAFGFGPGDGPGPNGNNTFGLCTAYSAGSDTGREAKRNAPPFQALEAAAEAEDQTVGEYCAEHGQQPGNGNGNGNDRRP
jgi:hypothetical protein